METNKDIKPAALLVNDIHVSKDNIDEFVKNWDEALEICRERAVPRIIVGGDLWQSRSAQNLETLAAVRNAVLKTTGSGIELILIPGNHDKVDQDALISYSHLFSDYPGVTVVDDIISITLSDETVLHGIAYFKEQTKFPEMLERVILDETRKNILYIHEGIRGGMSGESAKELPSAMFEAYDKVLVGHYHDRKNIPGTNIYYIGASRQHNFGENEAKGYTLLFRDGHDEFVQNNANIRFKVVRMDISKATDEQIASLKHMKDTQNVKLKVKIDCSSKEVSTVNTQKFIAAGVSKVEFITEQTQEHDIKEYDIEQKFSKETLKESYLEYCKEFEVEDPGLGIKYLDRI